MTKPGNSTFMKQRKKQKTIFNSKPPIAFFVIKINIVKYDCVLKTVSWTVFVHHYTFSYDISEVSAVFVCRDGVTRFCQINIYKGMYRTNRVTPRGVTRFCQIKMPFLCKKCVCGNYNLSGTWRNSSKCGLYKKCWSYPVLSDHRSISKEGRWVQLELFY